MLPQNLKIRDLHGKGTDRLYSKTTSSFTTYFKKMSVSYLWAGMFREKQTSQYILQT